MYQLHDLEIFSEAAKRESFSETAAHMKISVPAVSRAIARLERDLDSRLFNRTTRRLNLTDDGRLFLTEMTAGMERLRNAKDLLHEQRKRASGTVRMLVSSTFAKNYMMPYLPIFLDQHPDLRLDMTVNDYAGDLLAGGFEIAVQVGSSASTGYIGRTLGTLDIMLVASPDYLEKHGVPRTVSDLDSHHRVPCRGPQGTAYPWRLVHRSGERRLDAVHVADGRYFVNSELDTIIHAAVCGVGISPADYRVAEPHLRAGRLKVVLPEYRVDGSELFLLYPHRDHLPMKVRVVSDFAIEVARMTLAAPKGHPLRFAA